MRAQLAIIIPTLNRAGMLEPLIANIAAATSTPHRTYLVIEDTDHETITAAERLDTTDVIGAFGSCSVAVNHGYWNSSEPFVAVANDDCVFHDGWDREALVLFSDEVHVVGLNDGHGDMLSFQMFRRSFIREHSGVFDRPDTVYHTYKSQAPDTEFSFYAILRGVWAPAPGAVVEHCNWRVGADPNHPNYLKARDTVEEDLAEYNRRWPLWDPGRVMPPAIPTVQAR